MARSMKILLHTRSNGGGGAERVMSTLANGLAARGHEVTFAVDVIDPLETRSDNVTIVQLPAGHVRALAALSGLIRSGQFDVVISGLALGVIRSAVAKVISFRRVPLIISYHGFDEDKIGGAGPLAYHGMPFLKIAANRIVCVSDALTRFMIEKWGAPAKRTLTIHNPVKLPEAPPTVAARDRAPLVVAVGRLSVEKGMADLIEAFSRVTFPGSELAIAGDGPEYPALQQQITDLGLETRVRLLGRLPSAEALMQSARVVVIPSRSEAFSLVAVEALASGAALVATDCGGPREILRDGALGCLIPVGDCAQMAQAIETALRDPGEASQRLARAAEFGADQGILAWERLIEDVVTAR